MQQEPSDDESFVFMLSFFIAVSSWFNWYSNVLSIKTITPVPQRQWLYWCPIVCLASLFPVLTQLADPQVQSDRFYLVLFLAIAASVLLLINGIANLLGMGAIDNGVERRNSAAIWAICGAWIGATACIAGSNIGSGPTIYTTIESLFLSVGTFIILWVGYARLTLNPVAIAVERDTASGLRLAGLLVAWGTILGRAVASDWVSTAATIADFVQQAWITVPILALAIGIERWLKPNKQNPFPALREAGWYPAIGYGAIAALWLLLLASWI